MPPKSPLAEQEAKDKKMIDLGIKEAQKLIASQQYEEANRTISRISPPSFRLHYHQFEVAILKAGLALKQSKWTEARTTIQSAIRLKPEDPLAWKLFIQIDSKGGTSKDLKATIQNAMQNSKHDKSIVLAIAPFLKQFDDDLITNEFIHFVRSTPDGIKLPISTYIPETPETLDFRIEILTLAAQSDPEACSTLIHLYLDESDPFKAIPLSLTLPEGHPDRLYVETLLGDDPIGSALKHFQTGSPRFRDFLQAAKEGNISKLKSEISLIPSFLSGRIYICEHITDPKQRIQYIHESLTKFPQSKKLLILLSQAKEELNDIDGSISTIKQIQQLDTKLGQSMLLEILVRHQRVKEAAEILNNDNNAEIPTYEKAVIELQLYKSDNDINRLKTILQLPDEPKLYGIKAECAYELRNELGDKCESIFINALKNDKNNPNIYIMFGKYQLTIKKDIEKYKFLMQKAIELGSTDIEACELISKEFIGKNELEKALEICERVDTEWSHFRSGLIQQRLKQHENAVQQFQITLRYNPNCYEAWSSLGYSYIILGRIMAAKEVTEELRKIGKPDKSLENQVSTFLGRTIEIKEFTSEYFEIETNPLPFYTYLQQIIILIRRFKRFGRLETCNKLINNIENIVEKFAQKWNSLSSVLKICGDFYVECFDLKNDAKYSLNSFNLYKKRVELDLRAESFIDLSHSLYLLNKPEDALNILRRVIKTFPTNSLLWMNLGISFALNNRYPFARHCLCVSSKLSTDIEASRSFGCCAAIANLINDEELFKQSTNMARQYNPYDPDVWELLTKKSDDVSKFDAALIAFEFGCTKNILEILPSLCLRSNHLLEALNFALISRNRNDICQAYEAIGDYENALKFVDDNEEIKNKILLIGNYSLNEFKEFDLYKNNSYEDAAKLFAEKDDIYNQIAYALCLHAMKKNDEAIEVLNKVKSDALFLAKPIDRIILSFTEKSKTVESPFIEKDPLYFFLNQLRANTRYGAAKATIKRFPSSDQAIRLFLYEMLNCKVENDDDETNDFALTKARALFKQSPSKETLTLLVIFLVKCTKFDEAKVELQKLCVLCPSIIPLAKNLLIQKQRNFNV
ncbi:TPR-like protein [Histomonas meleagridis]|uniref:TPR-like protein n=1 Tax=Histomonas meleagridis TaxID=135588 RepID=UPI003559D6F2|nr:TPR-like protein [Histomonas meleagridis]KAH0804073.1 TPR-like protein [Histomonas meleagridis]